MDLLCGCVCVYMCVSVCVCILPAGAIHALSIPTEILSEIHLLCLNSDHHLFILPAGVIQTHSIPTETLTEILTLPHYMTQQLQRSRSLWIVRSLS